MNQKGFAPIIILVAILFVIAVGGAYYLGTQNTPKITQPQSSVTQAPQASSLSTSPSPVPLGSSNPNSSVPTGSSITNKTAAWKTYSYPNFNYSFKLPVNYLVSSINRDPKETYVLQLLDLSETNANMGPNDFIVSVQSQDLSAALQVLITESNMTKSGTKIINGREWTIASGARESQYLTQFQDKTYTVDGRNINLLEQTLSTFIFTP